MRCRGKDSEAGVIVIGKLFPKPCSVKQTSREHSGFDI
jgi:hypothetical protein